MMKLPDFFRNKQNQVVIWQTPNLLLWMWIVATTLTHILDEGTPQEIFKAIARAAIIVWAILEVSAGASYFRRSLGIAVLIITLLPLLD